MRNTLLMRQYRVRGKLGERNIDATGNETMVWKKVGGQWKIAHPLLASVSKALTANAVTP